MRTWVTGHLINPEELQQDDDGNRHSKQPQHDAFHDGFQNKGYVWPTSPVPAWLPLRRPVTPHPLHEGVSPPPQLPDPSNPGQPAVQERQGVLVLIAVILQPV